MSDHRKARRGSPSAFRPAGQTPHIVRCWHEWEFDGSDRRIILCLETKLELRPGAEGFDPLLLDELIAEATDLMRASVSPINSIRIVPAERQKRAGGSGILHTRGD
jgi:hypothetical protein